MKKKIKTNEKALEVRDGLITRTALLNLAEDLYETKTELEKAKDYTDNIIKSMIDTLIVVDSEGKTKTINKATSDLLGYKEEELIGKPVATIFAEEEEEEEDIPFKGTKMKKLIEEGSIRDYDMTYRTKSGKKIPVNFSGSVMRDKDGNLIGIVGIARDMREIKRLMKKEKELAAAAAAAARINAENALKETHTLLDAIPEGIIMMDLKGRITEVSNIALEIMGDENKANFIGEYFSSFVPPEEIKKIREMQKRTMAEGLVQNIEFRLTKKNRTQFISEITSTLIQESDGKPKAFMAMIRDISQRKQMEQKLIHTERMAGLGGMATGIAHEINQPLNTISLSLENILLEIKTKKTIDETYLRDKSDKIFENILRIGNIIDHIRAFSRGHDDYILTSFDINDSIKNAISMVSEQYKHKAIDINISLDKKIQPVLGNTYKFEQVILNLLTNAADAMEEKGKTLIPHMRDQKVVNISTYQDDQTIYVEVKDNGIGINANEIDKIMLPFYSTKDAGKGTGLGLSISFGIIKEIGGNIEIQSETLIGTTIRITLPLGEGGRGD